MAVGCSSSILKTIRRMMGPDEDYEYFDQDLIIHINAAFSRLCQIGVGPETPFRITGTEETWGMFMDDGYQEECTDDDGNENGGTYKKLRKSPVGGFFFCPYFVLI